MGRDLSRTGRILDCGRTSTAHSTRPSTSSRRPATGCEPARPGSEAQPQQRTRTRSRSSRSGPGHRRRVGDRGDAIRERSRRTPTLRRGRVRARRDRPVVPLPLRRALSAPAASAPEQRPSGDPGGRARRTTRSAGAVMADSTRRCRPQLGVDGDGDRRHAVVEYAILRNPARWCQGVFIQPFRSTRTELLAVRGPADPRRQRADGRCSQPHKGPRCRRPRRHSLASDRRSCEPRARACPRDHTPRGRAAPMRSRRHVTPDADHCRRVPSKSSKKAKQRVARTHPGSSSARAAPTSAQAVSDISRWLLAFCRKPQPCLPPPTTPGPSTTT